MVQFQKNVDLAPFNTFQVSVQASNFTIANTVEELKESIVNLKGLPFLVLGEGANILFTKDFPGLIIKNRLRGRKLLAQNEESISFGVSAGENWHELVMWSVGQGLSGIENLALIPGTVGAAPVQNLAAYGQTFGEVAVSVKGYSLDAPTSPTSLAASECRFFYRDSVFKHILKDKFFITSVVIKLSKKARFDTNYHGSKVYESLARELDKVAHSTGQTNGTGYSPKQVAQAVVNLRTIKMPDWHVLGTAGSFFKNPFVTKQKFEELKKEMPDLQAYPIDHMLYPNPDDPVFTLSERVKIPAGRLLDNLGWRGKRIGRVGTFERHALVIVNHGGATGEEILEFSQKMQEDVKKNYEIELEPEVNIL